MSDARKLSAELEQEMTPAVRAFVQSLFARIDELTEEVDRLRRELKRTKRFEHDSKETPPDATSSQAANPEGSKTGTPARRRGGQPGHPKAERSLIPAERCAEVVSCKPTTCRGCGAALQGDDPEPLRHQVTDIPPIQPVVTEYQRHRLSCPCCGVVRTNRALLPGRNSTKFTGMERPKSTD